jgi:hypothetical protein
MGGNLSESEFGRRLVRVIDLQGSVGDLRRRGCEGTKGGAEVREPSDRKHLWMCLANCMYAIARRELNCLENRVKRCGEDDGNTDEEVHRWIGKSHP